MSLEAMQFLTQEEERLRRQRTEAAALAKSRRADAHTRGEAALAEAEERARRELAQLLERAEAEAKSEALAKSGLSAAGAETMRTAAAANMDKAASFIVERIVKG